MDDYLSLDEELTTEERLIRDGIRNFVEAEVIPIMGEAVEKAQFPEHLIPKLADLGVLGSTLPEEFGGSNSNYVSYGLVCQELERGDSALRSFVSVQSSLVMFPIFKFGSLEQKQNFLLKLAQGKLIGCFGLTEPDAGSDPGSMKTTAIKKDGGYLLNGSKMWITNAPIADLAIIWAKTSDGIRGFIVEKNTPGFSTQIIKHKLSLRASITGEIILTDCFVPESHLLPGTSVGLSAALKCLTEARFGIAWGAMGAAEACYEAALAYAKERQQFQRPIASFQMIQRELVQMLVEIVKAKCLNLRLGRLKDKGQLNFEMVSLGKLNACQEALKIARSARNILGANGISLEYPIIRHMTNLESVFTYEGTDNIHHLILGKFITGVNAMN